MGITLTERGGSKGPIWPAVLILLTALMLLVITHKGPTGDIPERRDTTSTTVCFEDMGCWDCETMGNGVCGTIHHDS